MERLLFNRKNLGLDFVRECREASVLFLRHVKPLLPAESSDVSEMMILTKGYYYFLHAAYELAFRRNLPINFVATNRTNVSEEGVTVKVHFANFDAATETLLIGDTIASGETVRVVLEAYLEAHSLRRVIILSYAGTIVGAQRITSFCLTRNIEPIFLFGLAAFGIAQNGFDIAFLHNQTIASPKYLERARSVYHDRGISVAGWDFGSQAQAPKKYHALARIEAHYWDLPQSGLFPSADGPIDGSLVVKERSAYASKISRIDEIE
ncbi:MAG TPA: hypothetical protein VGC77_12390 [Rhodopseudomonas sp.]|uniref:hypothetical protein n=1 Tax=Rhodopseudomonas sp. TaxID=1078 RepID=UPI002EDB8715